MSAADGIAVLKGFEITLLSAAQSGKQMQCSALTTHQAAQNIVADFIADINRP